MTRIGNAKVLVSGAGIAGTALAWWLAEHGAEVTVAERADAPRDGGYKVDIRGAALTVVERMGLLDQARALRTGVRTGSVVDATGRRVASMDADTFGGRVHDDAELLRGDLSRILREATADRAGFRFGTEVAALDPDGTATFAGGARERYDLVVGADGLRSATRTLAFGAGGVHDLGHYVAIWSVPNHLGLDREELTYVGPGRTALVYSTAGQHDAKAMFLFAGDTAARPRGREAQERFLTDAYAGEGWEVPKLLAAMGEADDLYFDTISQVRLDAWSRGRVVLVGDAAYCASPASGQGTSLALVGAYVLAGELATAGLDAGPARYEERMRPFVAANQKLGPANIKRMVLRSRGQVRMSMRMLGVLNRLPGKERLLAKVVEPIHRAATAITL
ncbi:FAD-dependent monooxygenase [Asanoa siamensis]|nr:FAD-dependent monooxygenase [Asanoa siamensis]